jgi:hypothetical protein
MVGKVWFARDCTVYKGSHGQTKIYRTDNNLKHLGSHAEHQNYSDITKRYLQ